MEELALFARLSLAFLFLTAALSKLSHYEEHIGVIINYKIVPESLVRPFSLLEVIAELVVSALLLSGFLLDAAALGAIGLLVMYIIALTVNLLRGRTEITCGCGGAAGNHRLSWWLVLRNFVLIGIGAWLYTANPLAGSVDGLLAGQTFSATFGGGAPVAIILSLFFLLYLYINNQVSALRARMNELLTN